MFLDFCKVSLVSIIFVLLISCLGSVRSEGEQDEVLLKTTEKLIPETLAVEVQGHENTSGRKVRQFGFPPPPPRPFGFGGYRPFPPAPGFYRPAVGGGGFAGGGFQRTRVVTRTQTRVVDRYQGGGFRGGFYG
ncbi:hypothetical protein FF38_02028 [Lucilia cuprina]|uniref:Uncharacterized protein n=1 Tax=Lucilia cuprina TaxID=7375 RepID=A0A0L0BLM9_LUCCU|nr:hypothetical protein CVS40_9371 [Lucilia cuprina]KNC21020.1 hypothetical protein FF38_02028 [Lucilia cuprina]